MKLGCVLNFFNLLYDYMASIIAQWISKLPAMQETWVWCLGQEDPLEKEMATHFSFLAWRIPWTEEPDRLSFIGSQRVKHNQSDSTHKVKCALFHVDMQFSKHHFLKKDCSFPHWMILTRHICEYLFLGFLFHPMDICVCFYFSIILREPISR